jgi:hypothetical protein
MAFNHLPCFDLMELVGQHVEAKRLDSCTAFWTHNGSSWRLVNNQFNNTVDALARHGKSITPSQCAKPLKYVQKSWNRRHQLNSGCRLPTPQWGTVPTLAAYIERLALDPVAYATWGNARRRAWRSARPWYTGTLNL